MTTENFITELFCRVDEEIKAMPKHCQASLWPSEVVTLGVLFALKGASGTILIRALELQHDIACAVTFEPFMGNGRARDVAAHGKRGDVLE